ncbi:serine hydrolase [Caenimonas sp. SL110]|uniref:serine hydrolase domain-containing protein n=1 Tax=Caenimonas sp. SL110 TaxID=1450524 RepID=UPI00069E185E|nr:serine hydrolase domain-containing protein [Caenimonas sp. SL110]
MNDLRRFLRLLAASGLLVCAPMVLAANPSPAAIDRLFAAWDKPDTPGAALAVVRDGKIIHSRGYGMANLEYAVPITPSTPFHAASLSKQFTALAIHMLAQEGKLDLDDPVRKYLPELAVEAPITIRHLLHHTSGMRDVWDLLTLAGLRMDDVITDGDILGLLYSQRELNFAPGQEELYSNSGYSLLGQIVRRVSGQTLAAFTQERVFTPLGMTNTHFHENYSALVKGRAYSYRRTREGYAYVALSFSNTGATSLFTTVEDLATWNANFDTAKVGGPAVIAALLGSGKLVNGRETGYASGLVVTPYRSVPAVAHSGSDAGYRAYYMRLPQHKLAVIVLGNAADFNAVETARRVADLYLEGEPGVAGPRTYPAEVELQPRDVAALAGDYEVRPGGVLSFVAEGSKLFSVTGGGQRTPLFASSPTQFHSRASDLVVTFAPGAGNEPPMSAIWKVSDREYPLKRVMRETPSADALQACVGDYYSAELRTLYTLTLRSGKLSVRYPRGNVELRPINRDTFFASHPLGVVTFKRDAAGRCEQLAVSTGRARNVRFARVNIAPV